MTCIGYHGDDGPGASDRTKVEITIVVEGRLIKKEKKLKQYTCVISMWNVFG